MCTCVCKIHDKYSPNNEKEKESIMDLRLNTITVSNMVIIIVNVENVPPIKKKLIFFYKKEDEEQLKEDHTFEDEESLEKRPY